MEEFHFCRNCGWTGETAEIVGFTPAGRDAVYLALEPGEPAPSGRCPRCKGHVQPQMIYSGILPTLVDDEGFRLPPSWQATISRHQNSLTLVLFNPEEGNTAEITIDANSERPRLEITSFRDDADILEQEAQLLLSIGEAHVALWPAMNTYGTALIVDDEGIYQSTVMTSVDFEDMNSWTARPDR